MFVFLSTRRSCENSISNLFSTVHFMHLYRNSQEIMYTIATLLKCWRAWFTEKILKFLSFSIVDQAQGLALVTLFIEFTEV